MRITFNWFWAPIKYARASDYPTSYLGFFNIDWFRARDFDFELRL